jgi:hypothetical protein
MSIDGAVRLNVCKWVVSRMSALFASVDLAAGKLPEHANGSEIGCFWSGKRARRASAQRPCILYGIARR